MRFSLPEERRIGVEVATEMTGQQLRLQIRQEADGDFFTEEQMRQFFAFTFLIGDQNSFSSVIGQQHGTVVEYSEIFFGELLAVNQRERQTFAQQWAKFFYKVER